MNNDPVEAYGKRVYVGSYGAVSKEITLLENLTRRAIIYLLATRGPLTIKELSELLHLAPSTVHEHVKKLKEAGFIEEASDYPKRFKVEIYYRLVIPYILISELNIIEKNVNSYVEQLKNFITKISGEIEGELAKIKPKCLEYLPVDLRDRFLHTLSLTLIIQAWIKTISELIESPFVYALVNDLNEKK
ncbi:MAG: winged helix-turn-helix domain-containing protein [Desulfurococcaceae archaeon]